MPLVVATLLFLLFTPVYAQTPPASEDEPRKDVVVVTGQYEPAPLEESERAISVLPSRNIAILTATFADILRLDPSLDLRQRASGTVQSGVSIRGGTFGQTLVLLNGFRLNDVQSANHNMDVPVPMESVDRIEVMRGTGSTFYGTDAIGGVVNVITKPPQHSEIRLRSAVGNFGSNQQQASLGYVRGTFSQQLSLYRDFSSGFRPNRDYRNLSFSSITNFKTALGNTEINLAHNDRPFGAENFYGIYPSWERTRTWFASLRQSLGKKTEAGFAFRRHTDLFYLYRDRPQVYTNRHAVESYQLFLRRHEELGANSRLHYGLEGYHDGIVSTNLGTHSRGYGAGYVAWDMRALRRFSFTLGARQEAYRNLRWQFTPTAGAGYWVNEHIKLRAATGKAFRLPTFTDLYYRDPANQGSADLRPEKAWSYEFGGDWNFSGRLRAELTWFQRRERDGIDYVRSSPTDIWKATNFQRLTFSGVESSVSYRPSRDQQIEFRYNKLTGAQAALGGLQSKYAFNFPLHSGVASWQGVIGKGLVARTRIGGIQRISRSPYAVWDAYAAYTPHRLRPFFQLNNITNTYYEEFVGVPNPGRGVMCGIELSLWR